jgi:hypothetical protein
MDSVGLGKLRKQSTGEVLLVDRRGKRELEVELESWERLSTAVRLVLAQAPEASA